MHVRSPLRFLPLLLACAAPAAAQEGSTGWLVDTATEATVRERAAHLWGVAPEALELEWGPAPDGPPPSPGSSISLSGSGSGGWFVVDFQSPVDGSSAIRRRVRIAAEVVRTVAARPLERGELLDSIDIARTVALEWGAPPEDATPVEPGWLVRRVIQTGEPLAPPAVEPPPLVRSGDAVQVMWRSGAVSVRAPGRAQGTGARGEVIHVRTESGRRVKAMIESTGVVTLLSGAGSSP